MKVYKMFMLPLAALAFAACSSDDEATSNQLPSGKGAVTINITSPELTKAITDATTGNDPIKVTGDITVTLTDAGSDRTISLTAQQFLDRQDVTFWNVTNPTKVTVSMNSGKASYENDAIETTFDASMTEPEDIPAYGEVDQNDIHLTSNSAHPGEKGGITYEDGAQEGDDAKNFQLYEATVQLAIPVARLEVSGITHVDDPDVSACTYQTLTIDGVYLDNVYPKGLGVSYSGTAFSCATGAPTNYCFDGTTATGNGAAAILKDAINPSENFLHSNKKWPADKEGKGQAYSYYVYGANGKANLPIFKIYFKDAAAKSGETPVKSPRYAMITSYVDATTKEEITKFEPGHIYRITKAKLEDKNIIGGEDGEKDVYGVTVYVTEATWTIVDVNATWREQGN